MELKEIQKNIFIKSSKIKGAGKGVFARTFIPKGEFLGWYRGKIIDKEKYIEQKNDDYIWQIHINGKEKFLDAKDIKTNNKLRYVNGARNKKQKKKVNVEAYQYKKQIRYRTIKNINYGEELIIDYGDEYF